MRRGWGGFWRSMRARSGRGRGGVVGDGARGIARGVALGILRSPMANFVSVINDQIRRVARRESRAQVGVIKRLSAQHRRDIAALKRQVAALRKLVAFLERQERRRVGKGSAQGGAEQPAPGTRFRADGLKSHRAKLGLSAADYGKLVGASGLSVYHWESGKTRPRREQVAKLVSVRGLGKREAMKRLELLGK